MRPLHNMKHYFTHKGIKCAVYKMKILGIGEYHNGYIEIPEDHLWLKLSKERQEALFALLDAPGGITFAEKGDQDKFWIGFDTMHDGDTEFTRSFESVKLCTMRLAEKFLEINGEAND